MKICNFFACSLFEGFRQKELNQKAEKGWNSFAPAILCCMEKSEEKVCWSVTTKIYAQVEHEKPCKKKWKKNQSKVKDKVLKETSKNFLSKTYKKDFKTLTKIEGLKSLVRMLRSPAHIIGPTATAPTTTSGLFDSCHRKIRLIGGNPVAFLGGLMS